MTPEQMQKRSQEKVNQIQNLMAGLQVRAEAREHVNREGFIEKVVFWIDEEQYPTTQETPVVEPEQEGVKEHEDVKETT
jgi:hypothetical protein